MADVLLSTLTGGSSIKSVQRGYITGTDSNTVVIISPVDLSKAYVLISYTHDTVGATVAGFLSASSNITIYTPYTTGNKLVHWQVVEYY